MATTFHFKEPSKAEINIEISFGIQITEVRGLNPPNPKDIFTRDWAAENGIDYYMPATRKVKASEVTMQFYAEDDGTSTALKKYTDFCEYLMLHEPPLQYRDTLQYRQANLLYNTNKPAWYQLYTSTRKKLVAEINFLNPTGLITDVYVPTNAVVPIITLIGSSTTSIDFGETYTELGATASDDIDGDITSSIVIGGAVDSDTEGLYIITYNVSDSSGNAAVQKTRSVTVLGSGLPEVETNVVSNVVYGAVSCSADFNVNLVSIGSALPFSYWGIYWGLASTANTYSASSGVSTLGAKVKSVSWNLPPDTDIYYKAYAENAAGTVYGDVLMFRTPAE